MLTRSTPTTPLTGPGSRLRAQLIDALVARRQAALAEMRATVTDQASFSRASKEEAQLAAQIRRLRACRAPISTNP